METVSTVTEFTARIFADSAKWDFRVMTREDSSHEHGYFSLTRFACQSFYISPSVRPSVCLPHKHFSFEQFDFKKKKRNFPVLYILETITTQSHIHGWFDL